MKYYVDFLGCEKRKLDAQRVIDHISSNDYTLYTLLLFSQVFHTKAAKQIGESFLQTPVLLKKTGP